MTESLSRTLSRYVASLEYEALLPPVVDKIKASLLHSLIVSIVGAETSHGKAAVELVKEKESKSDGATILVDGTKATRCGAAFANSKLMHATNQSDSYRMLTHPGPCIIPAGLATAELGGRSGQELITAVAAGYEVEILEDPADPDPTPSALAGVVQSSHNSSNSATKVCLLELGENSEHRDSLCSLFSPYSRLAYSNPSLSFASREIVANIECGGVPRLAFWL